MPDRKEIAEKLTEAASVLEAVRDEYNNDEYYNELIRAVDAAIGIVRARQIVSPTRKQGRYWCGCCDLPIDRGQNYCGFCGTEAIWDA